MRISEAIYGDAVEPISVYVNFGLCRASLLAENEAVHIYKLRLGYRRYGQSNL